MGGRVGGRVRGDGREVMGEREVMGGEGER